MGHNGAVKFIVLAEWGEAVGWAVARRCLQQVMQRLGIDSDRSEVNCQPLTAEPRVRFMWWT